MLNPGTLLGERMAASWATTGAGGPALFGGTCQKLYHSLPGMIDT